MAHVFGNAGAARCRTAWHRWRRVEILPRTLQTSGVAEFCLQAMPHADSAHVPAASALPSAGLECVPRLSDRKAAPDRASVVRAASCPFAAQSGPVRVASFPRRQNAGWRRVVQPKAAALRVAGGPDAFKIGKRRRHTPRRRRSGHAANGTGRCFTGRMGGKGGVFFFSLFAKIS